MDGDATQQGANTPGDQIDQISSLLPDDDATGNDGDTTAGGQGGESQAQAAQFVDPNEPTHTIKVDGEDRVIRQSELLAQAQKYLAGDRRLEEAAAARKLLEPEKAAIQQQRAQLQSALDHYTAQMGAFMQQTQPNWDQLLQTDPTEYLRQRHAWDARMVQLQQAQAAQAYLAQQQQAESAQHQQARATEEQQKLLTALPDWKDPAKARTEATAIDGYLRDAGFSDDERGSLGDHRMIVVARKAMLFDQLMAQQATANQRVRNVPPRAERPGASSQGQQADQQRQAALARFDKAPSVNTLADLL